MSADLDTREARLNDPHVLPLMELVRKLRKRLDPTGVPNVDPNDGGVNARVLFLLETPGPRAVGTRFVSRDNPDPTARNMGSVLDEAGFLRSDVVLWNVVPHYVSSPDKSRNVSAAQIREAVPDCQAFIDELLGRNLAVVVFCGRSAQRARSLLRLAPAISLSTFHTGAMSFNRKRCRDDIQVTFEKAFELISE